MIAVQTQNINNNDLMKAVDLSPNNQYNKSPQPMHSEHTFDKEGDGKVFKMIPTERLESRRSTLELVEPEDESMEDPLRDEQRNHMRQNRLDMFFSNAKFDSKPPPPPWLI